MKDVQVAAISTSCTPGDALKFDMPLPLSSTIQIMSPAAMLSCCTELPLMGVVRPLPNLGVLP